MRKLLVICSALVVAGCQQSKQDEIIVDGAAKIEVMPDQFIIAASVSHRGDTELKVLEELSDKFDDLREKIPTLEGIEQIEITSGSVSASKKVDPDCPQANRYNADEFCDLKGFGGSIDIVIEGSPAEAAGSVISFALENEASSVRLNRWASSKLSEYEQQALDQAMADARRKAERLAKAAGLEISRTMTIQYGDGFVDRNRYYRDDSRVASVGRVSRRGGEDAALMQDRLVPRVSLRLSPAPIEVSASVVAAFAVKEPLVE